MLLSSSSRPYYDKAGTLYVVGTFASTPVAQEVRTLVREGVIDAMSVAFIDAKSVRRGGVLHITQAELIAVDLVTIPSNPGGADPVEQIGEIRCILGVACGPGPYGT